MIQYFDPRLRIDELLAVVPGLVRSAARFDPDAARRRALAEAVYDPKSIRPLMVRPMDKRWCYYTSIRPIWNESRPDYVGQCWEGNLALVTRRKAEAATEGAPAFVTSALGAQNAFFKHAYYIPIRLRATKPKTAGGDLQGSFIDEEPSTANLSLAARGYLAKLGITNPNVDEETASLLWQHVIAISFAPAYRREHAEAIRGDWPRIPLPASQALLRSSAALGRQLVELLDTDRSFAPAQSVPRLRAVLDTVGNPSRLGGGQMDEPAGDLELRANWGYAGTDGGIMGGAGRLITRDYYVPERQAIENTAAAAGIPLEDALERLGRTTCDVYLNDIAYWQNVPSAVWAFRIGGYPVIKKWLSYREGDVLGRSLTIQEVRYVRDMARRLAAILLLGASLDASYRSVILDTYAWAAGQQGEPSADA